MTVLTQRESEVVRLLGNYRYLSRDQIERFVLSEIKSSSMNTTSWRVLSSLAQRNLIEQSRRGVGGPGGGSTRLGYFLTARGHRLARSLDRNLPARRLPASGTFLMRHALVCADVSLAFRRAAAANQGHAVLQWEPDWQAALRLGPSSVVPDAHLVYATPEHELEAFVEIDLGTEGTRFYGRKVTRYLELFRSGVWRGRFPVWPAVLTVTESVSRAEALQRAIDVVVRAQLDREVVRARTEFSFTALPRLLADPLGKIWKVAGHSGEHELLPLVADRHQSVD
jgi:hypothetical protein